jgi:hypothetical protein
MLLETKWGIAPHAGVSNPADLVKAFVECKTRDLFYSATHIPDILPDEYSAKQLSGTHPFLHVVSSVLTKIEGSQPILLKPITLKFNEAPSAVFQLSYENGERLLRVSRVSKRA